MCSSICSHSRDPCISSSLRFAKSKHHLLLSPIITYSIYYATDASLTQYLLHFYFAFDTRHDHVTTTRPHRIDTPKPRFQALTQELRQNTHHVTTHNAQRATRDATFDNVSTTIIADNRHSIFQQYSRGIPTSHLEMKLPAIARTSLGNMATSNACGIAVPVPDMMLRIV